MLHFSDVVFAAGNRGRERKSLFGRAKKEARRGPRVPRLASSDSVSPLIPLWLWDRRYSGSADSAKLDEESQGHWRGGAPGRKPLSSGWSSSACKSASCSGSGVPATPELSANQRRCSEDASQSYDA